MNREAVKTLSDNELEQVVRWAQEEMKDRTAKRKQETIAKIKAMAAEAGVRVTISGIRGRPVPSVKAKKTKR